MPNYDYTQRIVTKIWANSWYKKIQLMGIIY